MPSCNLVTPDSNGWELKDGKFNGAWFEGDMSPPTLNEIVINESDESENEGNLSADSSLDEDFEENSSNEEDY